MSALAISERLTGLWRHPDFLRLWAGQSISVVGSEITLFAMPLVAVLTLDAAAGQMGLLLAAGYAPDLLVSLLAGAWVDRVRRRPVLIATDIGRAALLASIPLAWAFDLLTMAQLYAVAFGVGVFSVFFRAAYFTMLPSLVEREFLVEGNGKFELSRSVARIAGPGLAGWLVRLLGAPVVLLLDAVSFLVSALCIRAIRAPEPPAPSGKRAIRGEIGEGLRFAFGNPMLRAMTATAGTFNLFGGLIGALFVLYATRELGIGAGLLGTVIAVGAIGALMGALLAARLSGRIGIGPAAVGGIVLASGSQTLIALAGGPAPVAAAILVANQALFGFGAMVFSINTQGLRQVVTPVRLLGRLQASSAVVSMGTLPFGALLGGKLGEAIGLRPAIAIGAAGALLAVPWLFFSPVRTLRELPVPAEEAAMAAR
ncbi:MAG: MFS transporter [Thermomicrobiales bacterium]